MAGTSVAMKVGRKPRRQFRTLCHRECVTLRRCIADRGLDGQPTIGALSLETGGQCSGWV